MSVDPRVYAVLVNYGRSDDTRECLDSLFCITGAQLHVVLIDNGSPDDSARTLALWLAERGGVSEEMVAAGGWFSVESFSGLSSFSAKFVATSNNLGFAGGCNVGIRIALQDPECNYVWLLNNDTTVEADAISAMVDRFNDDDKIGMCGSTLVYNDPKDVIQACGGRFNTALGRGRALGAYRSRTDLPSQEIIERAMDYVVGASMLVSRDFLLHVGEMDERYFLYFEELDWAIRAKSLGYKLGWAPTSVVIHKEGRAIGTSTLGRPSDLSIYFMTASYLRLVMAHQPWLIPLAMVRSATNIVKWFVRRDHAAATAVTRGIIGFVTSPREHRPTSR